ncbi:MAG TPA: hypothetical protein VFD51_02800 [Patescibacteria group bacterium]|nr:hypothetical protein [Patescibacteria group bacterium]
MGIFGNKFEQPLSDEKKYIERAENEINILATEFEKRDWTEVWDSLCHNGLTDSKITEKMSDEAKEKFKNVINDIKEVFVAEKDEMKKDSLPDKDLVSDIKEALDKISEKL